MEGCWSAVVIVSPVNLQAEREMREKEGEGIREASIYI
jgi:hypothetical protein